MWQSNHSTKIKTVQVGSESKYMDTFDNMAEDWPTFTALSKYIVPYDPPKK